MSEPTTSFQAPTGFGGSEPRPKDATRPERRPLMWSGATDIGLLLLRFAVGGVFFAHGMQKIFGLWGGPGVGGFARNLDGFGYTNSQTLSWVTGIGELVLGAFVVLGILTPFAAAGLLAVKINAVLVKVGAGAGFFAASAGSAGAVELDVVLGMAAAALVFTGPGRVALDRGPWHRRPAWSVLSLVLGIGVAVLVYLLLR